MAPMVDGLAGQTPGEDDGSADSGLAWLAVAPAAAVGLLLVALLGGPLGKVLFPVETSDFWPSALKYVGPEPTEEARYLLALLAALFVPAFLIWAHERRFRLEVPRPVVLAQQLAFVLVLVLATFCRLGSVHLDISYFTLPTVVVAIAIGIGFTLTLGTSALLARARTLLARRDRVLRWGAVAVAALATAIWLLPAIQRDATVLHALPGSSVALVYTFDEGLSVLNGHTPLVDYVAQYGSLWPYVIAIPLHFGNGSLAAYTTSMAFITWLAMLAVYGVIRRVAGGPIAALLLFLPFLATSFFIIRGHPVFRYSFADYFGIFPLRYAGPFFVLYLLARHLAGERPRRIGWIFVVAGLAVLNNGDFGIPALGATAIAVVVAADVPRTRRRLLGWAGEALLGLLGAFVLVSIVTLSRTGELPDVALVFRYAHIFALAGYYLLPMPWFGFWVAIYLTYCAALVVATLLMLRPDHSRLEVGAPAWIGVFGLGIGAYYAGRSHYEVLIAMFSAWGLAIIFLLVVLTKELVRRGTRPSPAHFAVFVGFGLMVCSLAQFPAPWKSVRRLERNSPEIFQPSADEAFIGAYVKPGEPVALLAQLGQRMSRVLGVDDVTPYSAVPSMPTRMQLKETIEQLRENGGTKVFFQERTEVWPEMPAAIEHFGFHEVAASEPPAPDGNLAPDRVIFFSDVPGEG
ncbi:MAG TPA: hypothetical protein VN522_06835 [Solirubrobacterales bacterium]|nr:hypothetical protein [Solirubrobacterales bacterium]